VSLDATNYISIGALTVSLTSLGLAVPAARRSKAAFQAAHAPKITLEPDMEANPILVPIRASSEDGRSFRSIEIKLVEPSPNPDGAGFGEKPPTRATCKVGRLSPGGTITFPLRLALAMPDAKGEVSVLVIIKRGTHTWMRIDRLRMPYDIARSIG
jgi:hypothetical protein